MGSMARGMSNSSSSSSSQSRVSMLYSMVREALVRSVTWALPPVSFQTSQVSTVPNRISPFAAFSRLPGTWSRIHLILLAEKYASGTRPVFLRMVAP